MNKQSEEAEAIHEKREDRRMLSEEKRERARERWNNMFEVVYAKDESLFEYGREILIIDIESLKTYGMDGKEYIFQIAEWEKNTEEEMKYYTMDQIMAALNSTPDIRGTAYRELESKLEAMEPCK